MVFVNCGATGCITGIGNALPKEVLLLVELSKKQPREMSLLGVKLRSWMLHWPCCRPLTKARIWVLYYKHLLVLNGKKEYTLHFNASDVLTDSQRRYAESQYQLFRNWYAAWSKGLSH